MTNDLYLMNDNKLLWHMDRVRAWERGERVAPILIDIGLTKICNIRCQYCYGIYQQFSKDTVIPKEVLVKLFYDAPHLGVKALTMTGDGEPTLNPAMYDAIITGKREGLDIGVATNGIAMTEEQIAKVCGHTVWTRINISASNRESYKRIHRGDYFDIVMSNADLFMKHKDKMTFGFQMVLIPDCLEDVIPLAKIAIDKGLDYLVIKQFSDPGDKIPCRGFSQTEFVDKARDILTYAEHMSNDKTKIIVKWDLINRMNRRCYDYCLDLPFIFQVSGNSKCYPCGYLFNDERYCYGDLREQSLEEIITSDRYWKVISDIAATHTSVLCPTGCCRHDQTNVFINKYVNRPPHINFI